MQRGQKEDDGLQEGSPISRLTEKTPHILFSPVLRGLQNAPCPRLNKVPLGNHTPVFLSHAQCYIFAKEYDIKPFQKLGFQHLQYTLPIYTLYEDHVYTVLALLRYEYVETAETD